MDTRTITDDSRAKRGPDGNFAWERDMLEMRAKLGDAYKGDMLGDIRMHGLSDARAPRARAILDVVLTCAAHNRNLKMDDPLQTQAIKKDRCFAVWQQ